MTAEPVLKANHSLGVLHKGTQGRGPRDSSADRVGVCLRVRRGRDGGVGGQGRKHRLGYAGLCLPCTDAMISFGR